jgi:hypothetical protein
MQPNCVLKKWDRHIAATVFCGTYADPLGAGPIFQRPAMMRSLALMTLCLVAAAARADVLTIGASRDNTIFAADSSASDGGGIGMFVGTDASGAAGDHRALVGFDVAGNVPAGAIIQSVDLTLTLGQVAGAKDDGSGGGDATPRTISLFRLSADWGEGTAGAGTTQIAHTGGGFGAGDGDATWTARAFSASTPTLWSALGGFGDYATPASASQSVGNPGNVTTPFTWSSTAAMVSDAQSWLDDPAHNFGWILVNSDDQASRAFRAFYTREFSNPQFRPALEISYVLVPEPAAFMLLLLGAGGLGVVAWGRRRSGKQGG